MNRAVNILTVALVLVALVITHMVCFDLSINTSVNARRIPRPDLIINACTVGILFLEFLRFTHRFRGLRIRPKKPLFDVAFHAKHYRWIATFSIFEVVYLMGGAVGLMMIPSISNCTGMQESGWLSNVLWVLAVVHLVWWLVHARKKAYRFTVTKNGVYVKDRTVTVAGFDKVQRMEAGPNTLYMHYRNGASARLPLRGLTTEDSDRLISALDRVAEDRDIIMAESLRSWKPDDYLYR